MGLVTHLLLFPVTGPLAALRFLLERLRDEAEAVLRDEGRAFAELIDLSMRHNAGQLSDDEYAAQETELLERLNSMRDYRQDLLSGAFDDDFEQDGFDDDYVPDDDDVDLVPSPDLDDEEEW